MKRLLLLGAMLAAAVRGGGLPLTNLPATVKWALHADVRALRASPLGEKVLAAIPGSPAEAKIRAFAALTSIDLQRDVDAITLCGSGGPEQGALVYLAGRWDLPRLNAIVAGSEEFASKTEGRHTLMNWKDGKPHAGSGRQHACFVSTNLAVLADREEALRQALAALDGEAPALNSVRRFQELSAAGGRGFASLAAIDVNTLVAADPNAAWLQQVETVRLDVRSDAEGVRFELALCAAGPEVAQQVQQVLAGFQSLAMLQGLKNPDLARIAQSARIGAADRNVSASLAIPMDLVTRALARSRVRAAPPPPPDGE
jgi:hypothetical protein